MDEKKVEQYIHQSCKKYGLLHYNKKIILAPDIEIRIYINKNQRNISFHEYIDNSGFNNYIINYTINGIYRCYYFDKYRDFNELGNAIEYCVKKIAESI